MRSELTQETTAPILIVLRWMTWYVCVVCEEVSRCFDLDELELFVESGFDFGMKRKKKLKNKREGAYKY